MVRVSCSRRLSIMLMVSPRRAISGSPVCSSPTRARLLPRDTSSTVSWILSSGRNAARMMAKLVTRLTLMPRITSRVATVKLDCSTRVLVTQVPTMAPVAMISELPITTFWKRLSASSRVRTRQPALHRPTAARATAIGDKCSPHPLESRYPMHHHRRDVRVVYGGGLENRCAKAPGVRIPLPPLSSQVGARSDSISSGVELLPRRQHVYELAQARCARLWPLGVLQPVQD